MTPPKQSAKQRVLKAHKHAYCCRVFAVLQGHPTVRSTAYFGIFKTAKSKDAIGIGLTEGAAWNAAAANLPKGGKKR